MALARTIIDRGYSLCISAPTLAFRHYQVKGSYKIDQHTFVTLTSVVFLPTILEEMGYSSVNAQGLTAPPFFLSFLVTIISVYIADKTQQRGFTVIVMSTIGCIGYVLLAACKTVGVRYFGVFLAAAGIFPTIANILPWVLSGCSFPFASG